MIQNARLAVPHGILFLIDPTNVETIVPEHESGVLVASTATCIAVGTQPDTDGEIAPPNHRASNAVAVTPPADERLSQR